MIIFSVFKYFKRSIITLVVSVIIVVAQTNLDVVIVLWTLCGLNE